MADLDELRALLAVVEHGSTKAAAEATGIPRSTVRRRIDALEQRIGAPLLWTDARGTRPSPKGRLMVAEAQALLGGYAALIERARAAAAGTDAAGPARPDMPAESAGGGSASDPGGGEAGAAGPGGGSGGGPTPR